MQSLVSTVLSLAREKGAARVLSVSMKVGELTHLNPEQLRFAFDVLTEDTEAKGAELVIEVVEAKVRCRRCGYEGGLSSSREAFLQALIPIAECPRCGSVDVEVVAGRECMLTSVRLFIPSREELGPSP